MDYKGWNIKGKTLTIGPGSPFCPGGPIGPETHVGSASKLWKSSKAGGVTDWGVNLEVASVTDVFDLLESFFGGGVFGAAVKSVDLGVGRVFLCLFEAVVVGKMGFGVGGVVWGERWVGYLG